MSEFKSYWFSEKHESYDIDQYIAEGDDGPWYLVTPVKHFDELLEIAEEMAKSLDDGIGGVNICSMGLSLAGLNDHADRADWHVKDFCEKRDKFTAFKKRLEK